MDDYYSLLGVDPEAATSDIRAAYRDKKAALDAKGDKTEVARVNKAWNVLSDPYQRGRYDEQRARTDEAGELEEATVSSTADTAPAPAPRRRLFEPRPRAERPAMQAPTIELPAGATLAQQRPRIMAMVIDVIVMLVLLFGAQLVVGPRLADRWYPDKVDRYEEITDDRPGDEQSILDEAQDRADESDEAADEAEDENAANAAELREQADEDDDAYDELNDEAVDLQQDMAPAGIAALEAFVLLSLVYLVVPSALTGQTFGKKLQKIRVIRQDGSPLGWSGAFVRYGLILLATNLLLLIPGLGSILIAILFIFILGWMRNANRQAIQDRVAKTIVVDA
jgi:curved DNA-binding protein CbpA